MQICTLASQPLPNRPDGTLVIVQYSSVGETSCKMADGEFDRLSTEYADCVFLRCYREFKGADTTFTLRQITAVPTFEVFNRGQLAGKVTGTRLNDVQDLIKQFGFVVSKTDFFSSSSPYDDPNFNAAQIQRPEGRKGPEEDLPWEREADLAARGGKRDSSKGPTSAPRTTMRYFPGGMGQTAADNIKEKGSTLDEFQNARNGLRNGGVILPDSASADIVPLEKSVGSEGRMPVGMEDDDGTVDALNKLWDDYE